MNIKTIGNNIRKERKRLNLTIAQLAERADISDNFMGNIERGTDIPSLETIIKIANALIVSMDTILDGELDVYGTSVEADTVSIEINQQLEALTVGQKQYILEQIKLLKKYASKIGD